MIADHRHYLDTYIHKQTGTYAHSHKEGVCTCLQTGEFKSAQKHTYQYVARQVVRVTENAQGSQESTLFLASTRSPCPNRYASTTRH